MHPARNGAARDPLPRGKLVPGTRSEEDLEIGPLSLESSMACGFGVCWGCVTAIRDGEKSGYRRICREGPVFDAREVVW